MLTAVGSPRVCPLNTVRPHLEPSWEYVEIYLHSTYTHSCRGGWSLGETFLFPLNKRIMCYEEQIYLVHFHSVRKLSSWETAPAWTSVFTVLLYTCALAKRLFFVSFISSYNKLHRGVGCSWRDSFPINNYSVNAISKRFHVFNYKEYTIKCRF